MRRHSADNERKAGTGNNGRETDRGDTSRGSTIVVGYPNKSGLFKASWSAFSASEIAWTTRGEVARLSLTTFAFSPGNSEEREREGKKEEASFENV